METFIYKATKECFEWCKEQNFAHDINISMQKYSLIAISAAMMLIYMIYSGYEHDLNIKQNRDIHNIIMIFPDISCILQISFLIWCLWF